MNEEKPKSEITAYVGDDIFNFKISLADWFDELILKPLEEKLKNVKELEPSGLRKNHD